MFSDHQRRVTGLRASFTQVLYTLAVCPAQSTKVAWCDRRLQRYCGFRCTDDLLTAWINVIAEDVVSGYGADERDIDDDSRMMRADMPWLYGSWKQWIGQEYAAIYNLFDGPLTASFWNIASDGFHITSLVNVIIVISRKNRFRSLFSGQPSGSDVGSRHPFVAHCSA